MWCAMCFLLFCSWGGLGGVVEGYWWGCWRGSGGDVGALSKNPMQRYTKKMIYANFGWKKLKFRGGDGMGREGRDGEGEEVG